MNRWVMALVLTLILGSSNFLFQVFTDQDWGLAAERTWFQAAALFVFALNAGLWNLR